MNKFFKSSPHATRFPNYEKATNMKRKKVMTVGLVKKQKDVFTGHPVEPNNLLRNPYFGHLSSNSGYSGELIASPELI